MTLTVLIMKGVIEANSSILKMKCAGDDKFKTHIQGYGM
ncbi:hypothetical protein ATL10_1010175 [Bacillus sp. 196mf]|nr:hypothetical protein ATL10_1010175 [Bacillus sp. 196mf]SFL07334.1 hypothetical protein SAMN04488573_102235 [Bacillus sp. 5mfcol3.1]